MSVFNTPEPPVKARQIDLLPPLPKPGDIRVNSIDPLIISSLISELPADEETEYGLNRLAFLDKPGLHTTIDPWPSREPGDNWIVEASYSPGNRITIANGTFSKDTPEDARLHPVIPQTSLRDGVCDLVVGVRRVSNPGGDYERSPPLTVLIKTSLPGGPDPDENKPYHQGLAPIKVDPTVLWDGVTKDYL
jgi:hypothetical protein